MKSANLSALPRNKHQAKTEATRRDLLDAAEKIFVRDGYERTQIEAIAAEVGRTKGAVYAHFKGKEDLFLALFERKVRNRMEIIHNWRKKDMPIEDLFVVGRKLFVNALEEENWPILELEFKLFALRSTGSVERIRDLYQLLYRDIGRSLLSKNEGSRAEQKRDLIALVVLRGIPSAIALERYFDPRLQSSSATKQALEIAFDALSPRSAAASAKPEGRKPSVKQSRSSKNLKK
jgi:AcrR family transcriptional regulator